MKEIRIQRKEIELSISLLADKKSISDKINCDYEFEFYNHDLSIQYRFGIVKPNQIYSLRNERYEDFKNIDANKRL